MDTKKDRQRIKLYAVDSLERIEQEDTQTPTKKADKEQKSMQQMVEREREQKGEHIDDDKESRQRIEWHAVDGLEKRKGNTQTTTKKVTKEQTGGKEQKQNRNRIESRNRIEIEQKQSG